MTQTVDSLSNSEVLAAIVEHCKHESYNALCINVRIIIIIIIIITLLGTNKA